MGLLWGAVEEGSVEWRSIELIGVCAYGGRGGGFGIRGFWFFGGARVMESYLSGVDCQP